MGLISIGQEKAFDRVQHNYNNYNNYILSKRQLEQKSSPFSWTVDVTKLPRGAFWGGKGKVLNIWEYTSELIKLCKKKKKNTGKGLWSLRQMEMADTKNVL